MSSMNRIFNSLGSNYSLHFALLALKQLVAANPAALQMLRTTLEERFGGRAYLVFKGRDAIELALQTAGLKDQEVMTQAFACSAIEEGIKRAGARAVYMDLARDSLSPSLETLKVVFENQPQVKAVLIQHSLGYANPVRKIREFCDAQNLLLIEDLAQSFGGQDSEGKELGSYGDVIICSFGRDKVIDAVSGGAVIFKPSFWQKLGKEAREPVLSSQSVSGLIVCCDMCYPFLTWWIRTTHSWGLGKVLFQLAKRAHLLTSPIESPTNVVTPMAAAYATLALEQLKNLSFQLRHRRQIAAVYLKKLEGNSKVRLLASATSSTTDLHLRVPVLVQDPSTLATQLQSHNFFLSDRWYRQPVDGGAQPRPTQYKAGSCPTAEAAAEHVFNLPTHRYVTPQAAEQLAEALLAVTPEIPYN